MLMDIVIEAFIAIAIGIFTGLISGTYTGLVMARYTKFRDLRDEALRLVRGLEYGEEDDGLVWEIKGYDCRRMSLIGSDLKTAKHYKFGQYILDLHKPLSVVVDKAKRTGVPLKEISEIDKEAEKKIRKAAPDIKTLLSPRPRI